MTRELGTAHRQVKERANRDHCSLNTTKIIRNTLFRVARDDVAKQRSGVRSQRSTMLGNREVSASSIWKKPSKHKNETQNSKPLSEAAIHCKMETKAIKELRETGTSGDTHSHTSTVEAHESTRKRLESTLPRKYDDHIAEKRGQLANSLQFGSQVYSNAPSDENSGCESCRG